MEFEWKLNGNRGCSIYESSVKGARLVHNRMYVQSPWTECSLSVLDFHLIFIQIPIKFNSISFQIPLNWIQTSLWNENIKLRLHFTVLFSKRKENPQKFKWFYSRGHFLIHFITCSHLWHLWKLFHGPIPDTYKWVDS